MTLYAAPPALRHELRWLATLLLALVLWAVALLAPLHGRPAVAVPFEALAMGAFFWYNLRARAGTRWDPPRRPLPPAVWALLLATAIVLVPWFAATQMLYASLFGALPATPVPHFHGPLGALSTVWVVVVIAPLLEEFAFRGWLQGSLQASIGPALAIPCAAAVWALLHGLAAFVLVFLFGLVLGAIMWITGSIWPGVLIHAVHNAMPYLPPPARAATERALAWLLGISAEPWHAVVTVALSTLLLALLLGRVVRRCAPEGSRPPGTPAPLAIAGAARSGPDA